MPDSAIIRAIWCPDNLVPDKGSRFREGGIKGNQDTLIDKNRCTEDGLAPTTFASKQGEADSAIGMSPNNIIWLLQTENTPIRRQKGAECELVDRLCFAEHLSGGKGRPNSGIERFSKAMADLLPGATTGLSSSAISF